LRSRDVTAESSASLPTQSRDWWLDPTRVEGFVHGVFEGGGAKGVLYAGALEGMLRRKLWFKAVAGSSAGAITASMIAAGMTPSEMSDEQEPGQTAMARPTRWNGYRRLRWGTGFLDHERILKWLTEVLCRQSSKFGLDVDERGPTFSALSGRTGIDLFVVAVDLRARHLAVFNGALTPETRVAEAVMASATIPFALEPRIFQAGAKESTQWRLFVDGGVASNFPSFVFRDEAFRRYSGLDASEDDTPVVGFLLDEPLSAKRRDESRDVYRSGDFVGSFYEGFATLAEAAGTSDPSGKRPRFRTPSDVRRWRKPLRILARPAARLLSLVEVALLTLAFWLGRLVRYQSALDDFSWRWPTPASRRACLRLRALKIWLGVSPVPLALGLAAYGLAFWVGYVIAAGYVIDDLSHASVFGLLIGVPIALAAFVVAAGLWLLGGVAFLSLRSVYRSAGILGSGVVETYLNTSAPPWSGAAPNECVIHLTVPEDIRTLGIAEDADVEGALAEASETTFDELERKGVRGAPFPARARAD
jgi:predicted acylesterase/phospholipase RssA